GPSPYQALFERDSGIFSPIIPGDHDYPISRDIWIGTLQLPWAHANAAFESSTSGGVSMVDADGTLRTWNGTNWTAGAKMPEGPNCVSTMNSGHVNGELQGIGSQLRPVPPFPPRLNQLLGVDFLPMCFSPPVVEDLAHQKILAFRDGVRGLVEIRKDPTSPTTPTWVTTSLGV